LSQVTRLTISLGGLDGYGDIYIDDIRVYPERCVPAYAPQADFTDDCAVDFADLDNLAASWLVSDYNVLPTEPTGSPVVWYLFDETSGATATDETGNYDGTVNIETAWDPSGYSGSGCINFTGTTYVSVPSAVLDQISDQITISVWVNGNPDAQPSPTVDYFFHADTQSSAHGLMIHCPYANGTVLWRAGAAGPEHSGDFDDIWWATAGPDDWEGQWNHYAFTKNVTDGRQTIYRNGELVAQNTNATQPIKPSAPLCYIGARVDGGLGYHGRMDDFRIYNYELTQPEILTLADVSELYVPLAVPTLDLYDDEKIDFKDFAKFAADEWLAGEILWP